MLNCSSSCAWFLYFLRHDGDYRYKTKTSFSPARLSHSFTSRNTSLLGADGAACVGNDILSTSTLRRKLFSQLSEDEDEEGNNGVNSKTEGENSVNVKIVVAYFIARHLPQPECLARSVALS